MNSSWEEDYWNGTNPCGYSSIPPRMFVFDENYAGGSTGEYKKDLAKRILGSRPFLNSRILEVGFGPGYLMEDFAAAGVDVYGLDISTYITNHAKARVPAIADRFVQGDCRTGLRARYSRNFFDHVVTYDFIVCLTDAELLTFFDDCAFIGRNQTHFTRDNFDSAPCYNPHTLAWYQANRPNPQCTFVDILAVT